MNVYQGVSQVNWSFTLFESIAWLYSYTKSFYSCHWRKQLPKCECVCVYVYSNECSSIHECYCIRRILGFFFLLRGVLSMLNHFWFALFFLKLKLKLHKWPFPPFKRFCCCTILTIRLANTPANKFFHIHVLATSVFFSSSQNQYCNLLPIAA